MGNSVRRSRRAGQPSRRPQPKQEQPHQKQEQRPQPQQAQPRQKQEPRPQPAQPQRVQPPRVQQQQAPSQPAQAQARQAPQRLAQPQQQQRIGQQQQRLVQYGAQLDQQQRLAPQQAAQLQQQKRTAQFGFQQQYVAHLHEQQIGIQSARNYDYGGDPYFYTPFSYRYLRGGRYYETNDYGATVLRQAVNDGYAEGFGAGRADRQDHWAFDYRNSYAYRDANYGYGGFYIEREDYNYYFRQGFRRGYEDGYYSRYRYGVYSTGRYSSEAPCSR